MVLLLSKVLLLVLKLFNLLDVTFSLSLKNFIILYSLVSTVDYLGLLLIPLCSLLLEAKEHLGLSSLDSGRLLLTFS